MFVIGLGYLGDMLGIFAAHSFVFVVCLWDVLLICLEYACDMCVICLGYAWDLLVIVLEYAWDMFCILL